MNLNLTLAIVFGVASVVGVVVSIYYGRKSTRLENARKKLEWTDLQAAASDLSNDIRKVVQPDVIFTPGLHGATFANLLASKLAPAAPVFVGISLWKDESPLTPLLNKSLHIETNKWHVYIAEDILQYIGKKLLIIDDFAMSGDFLSSLKARLVEAGFSESDIKSATIAVTNVAIKNHKSPDFSWMTADDDDFYFPWGKAR